MKRETQDEIIRELGEARIRWLHSVAGSEKISAATLFKRMLRGIVMKIFETDNVNSSIAKKTGVGIRTVQRWRTEFHKRRKK